MRFEVVGTITAVETIARGQSIRELPRLQKAYGPGRWRKRREESGNGGGSVMDERLRWPIHEAQYGDLRPQINPSAAVILADLRAERAALRPVLIDRFFQLRRPIADSSNSDGPDLRLRDAGPFFYLVEALRRLGYEELDQTLCVLLDEFAQLEEHSYDELYLWCIVELSRRDARHARTYWPLVLTLDVQYRSAPWERPPGVHPVDRPYRLTELLFYYYAVYTPRRCYPAYSVFSRREVPRTVPPSLGSRLLLIKSSLKDDQVGIACRALCELMKVEPKRTAFGDALGLLKARQRQRATAAQANERRTGQLKDDD